MTRPSSERSSAARRPEALAPLVCVLLCGGESRRMGEDKARLELAGSSLLERALSPLRGFGAPLLLATGPLDRYDDLGLQRVLDAPGTAGPAAGLLAAMDAVPARRYLLVACDMPRLDARILGALLARAEEQDLDACLYESPRGREPLCAVYSQRVVEHVRSAQARGRRRVTAFLEESGAGALRLGVLRHDELDGELRDLDCARNLNTPDDLREERDAWEGGRA